MVKLNFFITCFVYKLKLSNTIAILIVNVGNYMAGKTSFPFSPEKMIVPLSMVNTADKSQMLADIFDEMWKFYVNKSKFN